MDRRSLTRGPRALLVDDDASTSAVHTQRLQSEGYQVTKATDPASALTLARQSTPDIIFIHVGQRGSGGSGFIQTLRGHDETRHIPIALLPKYYDRSLERLGLTAAAENGW
jgi:CheY-like chemotaxis protein